MQVWIAGKGVQKEKKSEDDPPDMIQIQEIKKGKKRPAELSKELKKEELTLSCRRKKSSTSITGGRHNREMEKERSHW